MLQIGNVVKIVRQRFRQKRRNLAAITTVFVLLTIIAVYQLGLTGPQTDIRFQPVAVHYGEQDNVYLMNVKRNENEIVMRRSTTEYNFVKVAVLPAVLPTPQGPSPGPALPRSAWDGDMTTVIQHTAPCVYSSGRSRVDGRWYNFSTPTFKFYAYSAILDDRPSLQTPPVLRIIAVTSKFEEMDSASRSGLACMLHYDTGMKYVNFEPSPRDIGYGWPMNNEWFKEYLYTCPLADGKIPKAVTVVSRIGELISSCLPVDTAVKPTVKREFAICVQVTYENPNPYLIIEWMELQRILGVSRVGVYAMGVKGKSMEVLQYYVKNDGFVDLRFTESIGRSQQQYMLHGSPVINDCMYRNMYSFSRILVIDFDEIVMPLQTTNLHNLMIDLDRSFTARKAQPPPANYVFYNNYFFLDLPPDISESPYLTFLRFTKRVAVSEYGYSVKSIIDPQSCLQMHNHYCWTITPGYKDRGFIEVVEPLVAVNQHYKKCHLNETECAQAISMYFEDSTVARFRTELKRKTREIVTAVLKQNI